MSAFASWASLDEAGFAAARLLLAALWQSSILFAAIAALARLLRKRRARARHALWVAALCVAPLLPVLAALASGVGAPQAPLGVLPSYEAPALVAPTFPAPAPELPLLDVPLVEVAPVETPPFSPFDYPWALLAIAYAAGLAAFLTWMTIGRIRIRRWIRAARPAADPRLLAAFADARQSLSLRRNTRVLESPHVAAPLTAGALRAVVLLPKGLGRTLSDADLAAVALHETAHVARRDSLVLEIVALVRAVLFFHPLVWLAARQVSLLAETACDDAVLEATGEPVPYARMLARLAENLPRRALSTEVAAGIVLSKSAFLHRIESILSDRRYRIKRLSRWALAATVLGVAMSFLLATSVPLEQADREEHRPEDHVSQPPALPIEGLNQLDGPFSLQLDHGPHGPVAGYPLAPSHFDSLSIAFDGQFEIGDGPNAMFYRNVRRGDVDAFLPIPRAIEWDALQDDRLDQLPHMKGLRPHQPGEMNRLPYMRGLDSFRHDNVEGLPYTKDLKSRYWYGEPSAFDMDLVRRRTNSSTGADTLSRSEQSARRLYSAASTQQPPAGAGAPSSGNASPRAPADAKPPRRHALSQKFSFDFQDTPLTEVVRILESGGVRIVLDAESIEKNYGRVGDIAVTLKRDDVTAEDALNQICKLTQLDWMVAGKLVRVSTKDGIERMKRIREQEIQTLKDRASALVHDRKYDEASDVLLRVLEKAPDDAEAKWLVDHFRLLERLLKEREWVESHAEDEPPRESIREETRNILDRLKTKISFDFEEAPIVKVLKACGINIVFDVRNIERVYGSLDDVAVTLKLNDVTIENAVTLICKLTQLTWTVEGGAVFISTEEGIELLAAARKDEAHGGRRIVPRVSEETLEIAEKLKTRISFDFENAPLTEVKKVLESSGINIVLDVQNIESTWGSLEDVTVTLRLNDVTVENALTLICKLTQLKWAIHSGILYMTTQDAEERVEVERRIYRISDLAETFFHHRVSPSLSRTKAHMDLEALASRRLAVMIRQAVTPEIWKKAENTIWPLGVSLVITAPHETHEGVSAFLAALRQSSRILVQGRLCRFRSRREADEMRKRLFAEIAPAAKERWERKRGLLTEPEREALVKVLPTRASTVTQAPMVLTFNGQEATVSFETTTTEQETYPGLEGKAAEMIRPDPIEVVDSITFTVLPVHNAETGRIATHYALKFVQRNNPVIESTGRIECASGETVLIGVDPETKHLAHTSTEDDRPFWFLLKATVIQIREEEAKIK